MTAIPDGSLEQYVPERDFVGLLESAGADFFRLTGSLQGTAEHRWTKRLYFLTYTEADELESFLDDYGARYNQRFCLLTELVASTRGFSLAGLSLEHLARRLSGYGVLARLDPSEAARTRDDLSLAAGFVRGSLLRLLGEARDEAGRLGLASPKGPYPGVDAEEPVVRFRLPRNVGSEEIEDEEQRIADVASKYLQACTMLDEAGVRRCETSTECESLRAESCTEELARVYEATVHNLQSTYDTYVKNTVLEERDERLPHLRGHVSATLHLLEAVTQLAHFVERHESEVRDHAARTRLAQLVPRSDVNEITVNRLLYPAHRILQEARPLAEALLPSYTNVQSLEVELADGIFLHARPASLIVSIVNHFGTPVELEVEGKTCNAGSILELMVVVGSHPEARRFAFRGDEHPLRDIGLLFQHGLGEAGLDRLPPELGYLRRR